MKKKRTPKANQQKKEQNVKKEGSSGRSVLGILLEMIYIYGLITLLVLFGLAINHYWLNFTKFDDEIQSLLSKSISIKIPKMKYEDYIAIPEMNIALSIKSIPFFGVFVLFILTWLSRFPLTQAMIHEGYNNKTPRVQQQRLKGFGQRALGNYLFKHSHPSGAHENCIESFAPFAIAVVIAYLTKVDEFVLIKEIILFLATRIIFIVTYLLNLDAFRSAAYFVGWAVNVTLFAFSTLRIIIE